MAKRITPMDTVLWLAGRSEKDAADRLLESRRDVDELSQTLAQLRAGRADYVARLSSGTRMGLAEMRELHGFVGKLDGAIAQLQEQLTSKEQVNDRCREQWQGQKRRTQALDGIAGRQRREDERRTEARSQREIDDRPLRRGPAE